MKKELPPEVTKLINDISTMEHYEEDQTKIEETMNFYCNLYDIRAGMLEAIMLTIHDQWTNHSEEQNLADIKLIRDSLNI